MSEKSLSSIFKELGDAAHKIAVAHGFPSPDPAVQISLIHSEVSETLEALRVDNPPDKHIPEFSSAEAELADVVIRISQMCHTEGWDLGEAIIAKMEYNNTRPYKHGGKKF